MDTENKVTKHISLEELQNLIQNEKNKHVFQRLLFILQLYTSQLHRLRFFKFMKP